MEPSRPTLRAFIQRLERDRIVRPDVRALLAVEKLLRDAPRDAPRAELGAALASILATDRKQWRAIEERFLQFLPDPEAFLAGEVPPLLPAPSGPEPRSPEPGSSLRAPVAAEVARPTWALRWRLRWRRSVRRSGRAVARWLQRQRPRTIAWVLVVCVTVSVVGFVLATFEGAQWLASEVEDGSTTGTLEPAEAPFKPDPRPDETTPAAQDDGQPDKATPAIAPIPAAAPPPTAPPAPPATRLSLLTMVALGLCSLVLAALGLRWLAAPQRHREARARQQREALELRAKLAEDDEGLTVTYAVEHHPPLALMAIDDAATLLGRLRAPAPGFDLDVPATLDATLRAAGMLVPVFSVSRQPLYLTVLVDVEKGSHPFLDGALWLLARWQQLGVRLVRHDFAFQPTRLRVHGTGTELGFDELSRRSAGAPLLIISRVTQLATRRGVLGWQRDLAHWSTCALLDLDPRTPAERSGEDERVLSMLAQAGLRRFPFTPEGLKALAHTLAAGSARPPADAPLLPLRAVEPAIRRWAACVACVPDPTWAQLEAFRRGFPELALALPDPRYLQRLLDWVRDNDRDPVGLRGERLAMSRDFIHGLVAELRSTDANLQRDFEARARSLILGQLLAATPETQPGRLRQALRIAYHEAILSRDPSRLEEFIGTPVEADLQRLVRNEQATEALYQRLRENAPADPTDRSAAGWSALAGKLSDGTGVVSLRGLFQHLWRRELPGGLALAGAAAAWPLLTAAEQLGAAGLALPAGAGLAGLWAARRARPRPAVQAPPLVTTETLEHRPAPTPPPPPLLERPPTGRSLGVIHTALERVAPMQFVGLTGGEFTMGGEAYEDEKPRHRVSLPAFQIATTPVTVRQWRAVMKSVPDHNNDGDDCPVVNLSWLDAIEFLDRLSETMGLPQCYERDGDEVRWNQGADGYRLPTEAEWEYAARGGTTTDYSFGDEPVGKYAWYRENSGGKVHAVGTREANPFGLHDIHGNVWEWVQDWYGPYGGEGGVDTGGPATGDRRVLRGGSFAVEPELLRSALRLRLRPSNTYRLNGLRVARGARPQPLAR